MSHVRSRVGVNLTSGPRIDKAGVSINYVGTRLGHVNLSASSIWRIKRASSTDAAQHRGLPRSAIATRVIP